MNSLGSVLAKLVALTGGAALGALLARLFDEAMVRHSQEQAAHDKNRYAQGLSPIQPAKAKE
jgi:hypothetical protein